MIVWHTLRQGRESKDKTVIIDSESSWQTSVRQPKGVKKFCLKLGLVKIGNANYNPPLTSQMD